MMTRWTNTQLCREGINKGQRQRGTIGERKKKKRFKELRKVKEHGRKEKKQNEKIGLYHLASEGLLPSAHSL